MYIRTIYIIYTILYYVYKNLYWSGGAEPARGMRISCVGPGPAGRFCPVLVTLEKGPKGLKNDQETCSAIVKREKVKFYSV